MTNKSIHEVSFEQFPDSLQRWISPQISSREQVLLSVLGAHAQEPTGIVITDYKLLFTNGEGIEVTIPTPIIDRDRYLLWTLNLEDIKQTMIENVQRFGLAAFRGKEWASIVGAKTGAYYFYFLNEAFCRKFSLTLTKAITEAKVRLRTPGHAATNVPDLADQLIKLSQLKRDGLLSETEFEAAKRKLLGT